MLSLLLAKCHLCYDWLSVDESDERNLADLEVLVWDPTKMSDEQLDSFLIMSRLAVLRDK